MRLLLASDLHCNDIAARRLVDRAADADIFVCAGDLAVKRKGLEGVVEGVSFWGIGGGIPVTPFGAWSFDLSEEEARPLLAGCPEGALLVTHSPPLGHVDDVGGRHMGSRIVLEAVAHPARPCGLRPHPRPLGVRIVDRVELGGERGSPGADTGGLPSCPSHLNRPCR